jgi:hypothetical protein
MIGEANFKGWCSQAEKGERVLALFITPNAPARREQQLNMFNMANARGLSPIFYQNSFCLEVGESKAYTRIAHPYLDRELKGLDWSFINGLEYLDAFEHGEEIARNLSVRILPYMDCNGEVANPDEL